MSVVVAEETPLQDDVRALVAELNAAMTAMEPDTPPEFNFRMTAEEMAGSDTTVWIARRNGEALGCCALRRLGDGLGEVKRMYVRPQARGFKLGALMMQTLEARARAEGIDRLALETGTGYHAAHRVYESAGFSRSVAFGGYPESPYSVFYAKALTRDAVLSDFEATR